jgi:hypothetical protein
MTIFKTAYDTTACAGAVLKRTTDAINVALAYGQLRTSEIYPVELVEGGDSSVDAIPAFAHPLLVASTHSPEVSKIYMDARSFGKYDSAQRQFVIRNTIEYKLALHRAGLNNVWVKQSPTLLRDISQLPMSVYASWLSESIARRYALDPREQMDLSILAGIFYSSLFMENDHQTEDSKMRVVNSISRALRVRAQDVLAVMEKVTYVDNVHGFCSAAYAVTGSVRLKELNAGVLYTIVGQTWFGTNAKEIIAVALEHPPTWLAILMAASDERTFKNSGIAKITERAMGRDGGKDYLRQVLSLLSFK